MLMYKDKVNPETVKKLMKESMAPQLTRFEKLCGGNIARKAFWTLDTAMTIHQILGTAEELHSLGEKSKLEDAILQKHVDEYGRMFDGAPCLQAIPRLDVLRKAVDASVLGEDEKLKELIEQAASLTLKVLCLVPAVGQIAMLISLAVETIEALGSVADMASDVVDRYLWRHRSAGHRLAELAQMHALQVRAIEKHATSPKRDDAYTQLRVRVVALIGLLRLIERCGSRQSDGEGGAAGGKGSFADKVRHYQIGQYIDRYIMLSKGPFSVALSSGTPLDEVWLYACGNKDITWNDIQASMHSPTELVMDFARGSKTVVVPIAFHRHYPIHGMDSANPEQLARTFSLNFAGVVDKKMVYSRVYLRQPGETRWVPADEARFTVDPATDVRIAAVFKSQQDLRGIPMSLQLKRVDPLINVNGPIYKTPLQRVEKSLEDVDDKGLLSYTEEKAFIGDKDAYSCVFYPFYFYRGALIHGIKPVSHVGLSAHTVLKYRFELKAGDDGVWVKTGKDGGRDLAIHLDPSNRFHVDMVLSKSFLDHKSAQPGYSRMFATEYETTRAEGLYYRFSPQGKWQIAGARTKKGFSLNLKDPSSGYRWKQPFEILLVFSSELVNRKAWDKDPVKFPAQVGTREPKWVGDLGNTTGPSYPVEVVCVSKDVDFTVFIPAQVGKYLERMEFLKAGEVLPGLPVQLGHNARALFATRLAFNFSVEEKDRKMLPIFGVRPFGREYLDARSADRDAEYRYLLDLASPDPIGLGLHDFLELRLPPLPADFMAGTALAGDTSWVTDEHKQTLTEVQQVSAG
jgi:hypothetical protein